MFSRVRGQATKSERWMPWRREAMKDVASCDKPRGAASRHRSEDVRMGEPGWGNAHSSVTESIGHGTRTGGTETSQYLEGKESIHASSGSTGKPTVVAYTRADLTLWANVLARGLVAGGLTSADVFQNAYGYGLFTGGLGFHDAASLVGAAVVPTSSGNTPRQVMLMRDFGVTAFAATPSYAINVAEVASAEGIDLASLPLRAAFVGAEPMSPGMQREIEERMGVRVYEQFGLSEIIGPGVASACAQQRGLHVWEDHFIPEIIDPESGSHLPDGEAGEPAGRRSGA